ncbi:MAG: tetratricopeptide repeat protein [Gemmataceae bacterium]
MPPPLANARHAAQLARYEAAASLLERAAGVRNDPNVYYMLAIAYKRLNKITEARAALRKISQPDADVLLQLALLSLQEQNLEQAEQELSRAWEQNSNSYAIAYNLVLTRLTLGKLAQCLEVLPRAMQLLQLRHDKEEWRFLQTLHNLLLTITPQATSPAASLSELAPADEQRLLKILRSLGQLDTIHRLLKALCEARPHSGLIREAYLESVLVKARALIDRCQWTEAEILLRPFAHDRSISRENLVALLTLLGTCAAMTQDFGAAVSHFTAALKLAPNDARLHQNLALVHEFQNELNQAEPYWNKFFDCLDPRSPCPIDIPQYTDCMLFEAMQRLASKFAENEKWNTAVSYAQRATQMRPDDPECLERLFRLYNNAKRIQEARRTLDKLKQLKPGEPQYELYELDLVEVKGLGDIERLLSEIDRIYRRHPDDRRVEERATGMVNSVIPLIGNICDNLTDQLSKVIDQVRNLPNYQINWAAVREVMRDLLKEFQKLRRIMGKCLPLVSNEDVRRTIRDLSDHIDKKIEACRSMGA